MSSKLQDINSITPMTGSTGSAAPKDALRAEYEEGRQALEKGDFGAAAVALHNALVGFEEKGDEPGIANASNQLGILCLKRHDYQGADKHFQRAYALCEKLGDPMSLSLLKKRFIEVQRGLKAYSEAIEACLDLLDMYHGNNDPRGTVQLLESMSEIYLEWGKTKQAADTLRTVASIHRNFKHHSIAESFALKAGELEASS